MEDFQYHAAVPWPHTNINNIQDYFTQFTQMEDWLNNYIGPHMIQWKYIENQSALTIGFNNPEYKTLFLIAYTK